MVYLVVYYVGGPLLALGLMLLLRARLLARAEDRRVPASWLRALQALGCSMVATLSSALLLGLLGLAYSSVQYHGVCIGFTDGEWPCTRAQYLRNDLGYAPLMITLQSVYSPGGVPDDRRPAV
jgi:hypothetical protein